MGEVHAGDEVRPAAGDDVVLQLLAPSVLLSRAFKQAQVEQDKGYKLLPHTLFVLNLLPQVHGGTQNPIWTKGTWKDFGRDTKGPRLRKTDLSFWLVVELEIIITSKIDYENHLLRTKLKI